MATVFLAFDRALERDVAIKVISPEMVQTQSVIQRFKREARTSAGLSHPNIIPVYAVKEIDGVNFFVMKFVAGRSLDSILAHEGSSPRRRAAFGRCFVKSDDALHSAHRNGVVHRDVKPPNVMIDHDGWATVTDFGDRKRSSTHGKPHLRWIFRWNSRNT